MPVSLCCVVYFRQFLTSLLLLLPFCAFFSLFLLSFNNRELEANFFVGMRAYYLDLLEKYLLSLSKSCPFCKDILPLFLMYFSLIEVVDKRQMLYETVIFLCGSIWPFLPTTENIYIHTYKYPLVAFTNHRVIIFLLLRIKLVSLYQHHTVLSLYSAVQWYSEIMQSVSSRKKLAVSPRLRQHF